MTVTAIETHFGAIAAGTSAVVTVTTSLAATDRLVVHVFKTGTTGTPTVSGLGTWTVLESVTLTRDTYMFTMTGAAAGGNVTITPSTLAADYALYVLRGGGGQVNVFGTEQDYSSSGTSGATPSLAGGLTGMFVSAATSAIAGVTITFPASGTTPASGWAADYSGTNVNSSFISQTLSADSAVAAAVTISAGGSKMILIGVFSEASSSSLVDTFIGWGNPIF